MHQLRERANLEHTSALAHLDQRHYHEMHGLITCAYNS